MELIFLAPDKKEIQNRWKYGIIFGTGAVLLFYNFWTFILLGFLASLISGNEFVKLFLGEKKNTTEVIILSSVIPAYVVLSGLLIAFNRSDLIFMIYGILTPIVAGLCVLIYKDSQKSSDVSVNLVFGVIYIALSLTCILYIYQNYGWVYALYAVTSPWLFDSFAFFIGIRYGKHKLMPSISPKKTIEGLVGGMIGTFFGLILITILVKLILPYLTFFGNGMGVELNLFEVIVMTLFITWGATFGDLFESSIKRSHHLKDAGDFLPGHGGLLDRVDSLVFVGPLTLFLMMVFR
jgi:phosphatidate cytidylyltransferase